VIGRALRGHVHCQIVYFVSQILLYHRPVFLLRLILFLHCVALPRGCSRLVVCTSARHWSLDLLWKYQVWTLNNGPGDSDILWGVIRLQLVLGAILVKFGVVLSPRLLISSEKGVLVSLFVLGTQH
jgi:hypothetical protein